MAISKKAVKNETTKLEVVNRLGCIMLNTVTIKTNVKGTKFVSTPMGAVYTRINEIKPGLYAVVELDAGGENPMLALNTPTPEDVLGFLCDKKKDFPAMSIADLKDFYNL